MNYGRIKLPVKLNFSSIQYNLSAFVKNRSNSVHKMKVAIYTGGGESRRDYRMQST